MDTMRLNAARRSPQFVGWMGRRPVEVVLLDDRKFVYAAEVRDAVTEDLIASTERGDGIRAVLMGDGPDAYREVVVAPGGYDGALLFRLENGDA